MKIVMAMAGRGSRLGEGERPKPLIEIDGRPMFAWALGSVDAVDGPVVFVALEEHARQFDLAAIVREHVSRPFELQLLPAVTEGQLCTVLAAEHRLDPEDDVLIVPCDSVVVSDIAAEIAGLRADTAGLISVISAPGDNWSFARVDDSGRVVEVAEKRRISEHASTGLYYFRTAAALASVGHALIASNARVRGEFYVMPVYQQMIEAGQRIEPSFAREFWDMGTPAALARFAARSQT